MIRSFEENITKVGDDDLKKRMLHFVGVLKQFYPDYASRFGNEIIILKQQQ